jgi:hypothetical protein
MCAVVRSVDVASSYLVWTVPVVAVAAGIEGDAGLIVAIDQGNGKP